MQKMNLQTIQSDSKNIEYFKSNNETENKSETIVFINGFRMNLKSWSKVIDMLLDSPQPPTVISFNRPGVGKSSNAKEAQTGQVVVNDMKDMLSSIGINGPIVLVGHSLGGIFANLYAREYPEMVKGVVLVDAPHPDEISEHKKQKPPMLLQVINNSFKFIEKKFNRFKFSEDEEIENTIKQIKHANAFPTVPLTVITGTKKMPFVPENAMKIHKKHQEKLVALSPISKHIISENSGHFPQIEDPKLVVNAIENLFNSFNSERDS